MLDWIFEGIVTWISSVVSDMMDAVSGLFLQALGTDMTAMEEYFPFVSKAFTVMQYTAWALLFLITVWQLFRVFGGPVTEAENPWVLLGRSALFAFLIGYAKPIFLLTLKIATAPYTALMDIQMTAEDFTFAGIEQALQNGLTSLIATISVVGLLLLTILEIALGWNYFKLLLETVERYIVVGVLCYTGIKKNGGIMEEKEFNTTFAIPANYTDSGKIFGGMLEPRNAVEALILILAIGYPELMLIPMATTIRIVVMTVTLIPIGILAAMGIDGDSLFQYAGHIICYLAHRRKLHLRRVGYKYDQRQLRKKKNRKKKA